MLLIATNVPPAPSPASTATAMLWTKPKYDYNSETGNSASVATCERGTTSVCPLNTGRVSRKEIADSTAATWTAGTEPATIAQKTHPDTPSTVAAVRFLQ